MRYDSRAAGPATGLASPLRVAADDSLGYRRGYFTAAPLSRGDEIIAAQTLHIISAILLLGLHDEGDLVRPHIAQVDSFNREVGREDQGQNEQSEQNHRQ